MKPLFQGLLLGAGLSVCAHAQVLRPIDQHQLADVNGKIAEMPTVNLNTVPQPTRPSPVSALTNQRYTPRGAVTTRTVNTELVGYSVIATKILPQSNFSAKRAVLPDQKPATHVVENRRAEIPDRTIRALTPAGTEELREQLLKPH